MKKLLSIILALFFVAPLVFAEFSLKVGGGFTTFQGDDYNKGMAGAIDQMRAYSDNNYGSYDGDVNGLSKLGMNFFAEAVYNFTPNIGIGLGAGYFGTSAKEDSFYNDGAVFLWWVEQTLTNSASVGVIPITLNFHYSFPVSPGFLLDFFAGPGLYLTNFHYEAETDLSAWLLGIWLTDDFVDTTDFKANKTAFGFQGGLGFEFMVTPSVSLFLNGLFRYLNVTDFQGDWEFTREDFIGGTTTTLNESDFYLWYFEFDYDGETYSSLILDDVAPVGFSNTRHAKLNLTGFSLQAGIKVRFGAI